MATATVGRQVRYMADGDSAWIYKDVGTASAINLSGLVRAGSYTLQIRNIDSAGRASNWVSTTFTVGNTNKVGAAAIPNIGNQQSMWDVDTSVTYAASTTADGVSTATISVSAGTLVIGSQTIAYGASSATIDGTASTTQIVYLYYDDPTLSGGTLTLGLTTNVVDTANVDGRVAITSLSLTFPAAGGSSSGGGGIGGGGGSSGACVVIDSWLPCGRQAGDINIGDVLFLCDPVTGEPEQGVVEFAATRLVQCVEFETISGVTLRCSRTAPIPVSDGYALAPDLLMQVVPVMRAGVQGWEIVTRVTDIGFKEVRHITVGDRCFWAGGNRGSYILHHNAKQAASEVT